MPVHVQVGRIETGRVTQRGNIRDRQHPITDLDQTIAAQLLDHPVDVNVCQAKQVADLLLAHREGDGNVVTVLDPEANSDLAE